MNVYHPFHQHAGRIRRINILKVFNSNAKPLLLACVCEDHEDDNYNSSPSVKARLNWKKSFKKNNKLSSLLLGKQNVGLIRSRGMGKSRLFLAVETSSLSCHFS